MMRILASADHHFDEHSPRWSECLRIHAWMVDEARRQRPDVFLSAGDIYDRASTATERAAVADWLTTIANVCPIVIAKGNHDRPLDCALLARLRTRCPIHVVERFDVIHLEAGDVGAVAWPNKSGLAAMTGADGQALDQRAVQALRAVLGEIASNFEPNRPHVLLMHAMVSGSRTSLGQPLIGGELSLGLDDVALARADLAVLGHIHCPQEWRGVGGADVLYTGSPFRTTFGESEEKSILLADVDSGSARWERLHTPATKMHLLTAHWDGEALRLTAVADTRGAEVRLRYEVAIDQRIAAKRAVTELRDAMLREGAVLVKVEEVVHAHVHARAPAIAKALSLEDKLAALWEHQGTTLTGDRRQALLDKLTTLEDACASIA